MGYSFPTNLGTTFKYKQWNIGIYMANMTPLGLMFVMGYTPPDGGEWQWVATIEGPMDQSGWEQLIAARGGMGGYIVSKFPQINGLLAKFFDPTPVLPNETNQTPFTDYDFNVVLKKFVGMEERPDNDCPRLKLI